MVAGDRKPASVQAIYTQESFSEKVMQDPKIYSDAYQLSLTLFDRKKAFPKVHRPTLGRRIEEAAMDLVVAIRGATTSQGGGDGSPRLAFLREASKMLDQIRIFAQLAYDLGTLPVSAFSEISSLTATLGKEIGGMIRYEYKGYVTRPAPGRV